MYSYVQSKCTAASLGFDKMKKLVKTMKRLKMIKLMIMRLRIHVKISEPGHFIQSMETWIFHSKHGDMGKLVHCTVNWSQ